MRIAEIPGGQDDLRLSHQGEERRNRGAAAQELSRPLGFSKDYPRGVLRSSDGGSSWAESSTGLPSTVQGANLCVSPTDIQTFFLADRASATGAGGLHKTTDAGQTWSSTGYVACLVYDVVCDPGDNQVIYVAQYGDDRVWRSTDGGARFAPFSTGLENSGAARDLSCSGGLMPRLLLATSRGCFEVSIASGQFAPEQDPSLSKATRLAGGTVTKPLRIVR